MKTNGITGNTYGVEISIEVGNPFIKVAGELLATDMKTVNLFLKAYRMGRDHKKLEIQSVLGIIK